MPLRYILTFSALKKWAIVHIGDLVEDYMEHKEELKKWKLIYLNKRDLRKASNLIKLKLVCP